MTEEKSSRINHQRIMKFLMVGVLNTGLDFLIFNILIHATRYAGWGGWQANICNMISASLVTMLSYELNSRYVFKSERKLPPHYRLYFLLIVLSGIFILQNIILKIIIPNAGPVVHLTNSITSVVSIKLGDTFIRNNFAKVCATIATMTWNYLLFKKLIFKPEN